MDEHGRCEMLRKVLGRVVPTYFTQASRDLKVGEKEKKREGMGNCNSRWQFRRSVHGILAVPLFIALRQSKVRYVYRAKVAEPGTGPPPKRCSTLKSFATAYRCACSYWVPHCTGASPVTPGLGRY